MDGIRARCEQRALDAVGVDLRRGESGLLRMRGVPREVRNRVHVALLLHR
jgi:hypothetical protein